MTYRGHVQGGVVILDGDKPADGTCVEVIPTADTSVRSVPHPAIGMWKDRTDLPADSVEASRVLRAKLLRQDEPRP